MRPITRAQAHAARGLVPSPFRPSSACKLARASCTAPRGKVDGTRESLLWHRKAHTDSRVELPAAGFSSTQSRYWVHAVRMVCGGGGGCDNADHRRHRGFPLGSSFLPLLQPGSLIEALVSISTFVCQGRLTGCFRLHSSVMRSFLTFLVSSTSLLLSPGTMVHGP